MSSGGESKSESSATETKESDNPLLRLFGARVPVRRRRQPTPITPFVSTVERMRRQQEATARPPARPRMEGDGGGASKYDDPSSSSSGGVGDRARIAVLEQQLADSERERRGLAKRLADAAGPRRSARVVAQNPGDEVRRLRSNLKDAQAAIVEQQRIVEKVSRQDRMTKEELRKAKEEINNLRTRLDRRTGEKSDLRAQLDQINQMLASVRAARDTLNNALQTCLEEKQVLQADKDTAEANLLAAQRDSAALRARVAQLESQLSSSRRPSLDSPGDGSTGLEPLDLRTMNQGGRNRSRDRLRSIMEARAARAARDEAAVPEAASPQTPGLFMLNEEETPPVILESASEDDSSTPVNTFTGAFADDNPEERDLASAASSAADAAASAAATGLNTAADVLQGATGTAAGALNAAGDLAAAPLNAAAQALGGPSLREIVENTIPERIMVGNLRKTDLQAVIASETSPPSVRGIRYVNVARTTPQVYTAMLKYLYGLEGVRTAMLNAGYEGFPDGYPWRNSLNQRDKLRAIRRTIAPPIGAAAAGGTPGLRILQSALRF